MYRWQILTLAKLEACADVMGTAPAQIQGAKRVLIDIGIQHFFEPQSKYFSLNDLAGYEKLHKIALSWVVDDRELQIVIWPDGSATLGETRGLFDSEEEAPLVGNLTRQHISTFVVYLLLR